MTTTRDSSPSRPTWRTRRSWPPTGPTPGPGRPARAPRCARASCSAAPAAAPCRSATRTATPAMNAPTPAPTTSPPRCAGRSAPTPPARPSPPRCWPRSSPASSPWRSPPPGKSPPAGAAQTAPLNCPPSGPATTPTGPNARSWPASRRTAWSPAAWLRWKSGASQQSRLTRRKNAIQLRSTDPAAIELACRIGPGCDNHALAAALNDAGHRTGTGQPFDGVAAGNLRNYHHIPYPGLLEAGELSPRQVAQRAGVSTGTIHYWINAGYLHARRGPAGRWAIPFPPEVEAACRDRAAGSAHQHRDTDPAPQADGELSIAEAARRLGVKPDVIYAWAQWGHLPARRGPAGRLWIHFTPEVEQACLQRIASSYKLPEAIRTQAAQRLA